MRELFKDKFLLCLGIITGDIVKSALVRSRRNTDAPTYGFSVILATVGSVLLDLPALDALILTTRKNHGNLTIGAIVVLADVSDFGPHFGKLIEKTFIDQRELIELSAEIN